MLCFSIMMGGRNFFGFLPRNRPKKYTSKTGELITYLCFVLKMTKYRLEST